MGLASMINYLEAGTYHSAIMSPLMLVVSLSFLGTLNQIRK